MNKDEEYKLTPNMVKFFDRLINLKHYVDGALDMSTYDEASEVLKTIASELRDLVDEENEEEDSEENND